MPIKNTSETYGAIAKLLHWVMAIIIIGMLSVGLYMKGMELSPDKFKLYGLHKSFGFIVLCLASARIAWKLKNITPNFPDMLEWQKHAANASHTMLYVFMFLMPLSGWMMSSAAGFPVSVFGWFTLPNLVAANKELLPQFQMIHKFAGFGLIALISVHFLAALYHHAVLKDNILKRMLPWGK